MKKILTDFEKKISDKINKKLYSENLENIKASDGRSKDCPICCKKGSFIYFLYSDNDNILYIGETGTSVKSRLFGDGSGAHCIKSWFIEVKKVKYYKDENMNLKARKLIERALIKHYDPPYNDKKEEEGKDKKKRRVMKKIRIKID